MPNLVHPIDNVQYSVERPVVYDIARQLLDIMQISHKTPIAFSGDEGKIAQKNSTLYKDHFTENYWPYNEKIYIEVEEEYEKDRILSTAIRGPENILVFNDPALGVSIKPIYSSMEVTIQFKYRAVDRNQANRWRNDMRTRVSMMRDVNLHEIVYHYTLPSIFIPIIREVHRLRENIAGYGESFEDYFSKYLTVNASVVSNFAGNGQMWAVSEKQARVQGYFDFEDAPDKPERDGELDAWDTTVSYRFKYDKPIECHIQYPLMVHQQILDQAYWSPRKTNTFDDIPKTYTLSSGQFHQFEDSTYNQLYSSNKGIAIPEYDEFTPGAILPASLRVFCAMASLEATDLKTLFNLRELGDVALDSDILAFMSESEYPFMGKEYASIFNLSLYEGSYFKAKNILTVDKNLNVSSTIELNLRKEYHVRLSMIADFSLLKDDALTRLRKFPKVAIKIIAALNAALSEYGNEKDLAKNRLSWDEIKRLGLLNDRNLLAINPSDRDLLVAHLIDQANAHGRGAARDTSNTANLLSPVGPSEVNSSDISLVSMSLDQQLYWLRNQLKTSINVSAQSFLNQTLFVSISE